MIAQSFGTEDELTVWLDELPLEPGQKPPPRRPKPQAGSIMGLPQVG